MTLDPADSVRTSAEEFSRDDGMKFVPSYLQSQKRRFLVTNSGTRGPRWLFQRLISIQPPRPTLDIGPTVSHAEIHGNSSPKQIREPEGEKDIQPPVAASVKEVSAALLTHSEFQCPKLHTHQNSTAPLCGAPHPGDFLYISASRGLRRLNAQQCGGIYKWRVGATILVCRPVGQNGGYFLAIPMVAMSVRFDTPNGTANETSLFGVLPTALFSTVAVVHSHRLRQIGERSSKPFVGWGAANTKSMVQYMQFRKRSAIPTDGTGILHTIWLYRNHPELKILLDPVEYPADPNLRHAAMVETRLWPGRVPPKHQTYVEEH
ncbi:hypothetical protein C8J57DRAFT_1238038 [Mycena rebaudengoi]|nr:hypothetical protein C8J57DRAFT_1238038 [Mycena rebaudengoi]